MSGYSGNNYSNYSSYDFSGYSSSGYQRTYFPMSYSGYRSGYSFNPYSADSYSSSYSFGAITGSGRTKKGSSSASFGGNVGTVIGDAMFEKALSFVLGVEGGYANVAGDKGGATNKGITTKTYRAWLKKNGMPAKDVKNITDNEVRQIYYNEFWKPLGCDKLPSRVALFIFDTAVNMGVGTGKKYLSRYNNGESLDSLIAARENKYNELASKPDKKQFKKGWQRRMTNLKSTLSAVA